MIQKDSAETNHWHSSALDSPVDGSPIRFAFLKPKQAAKRAILLLNGRGEWIEKYAQLPELFNLGDDVIWVSLDHRGQGGSGGIRAYVDSYADYAADAAATLEAIAKDLPYAIVSHSMGGLVALYGTLYGHFQPQVLALSSPLLGLPNTPIPRYIAEPLAKILSLTQLRTQTTGVGKEMLFQGNPLTSSIAGFKVATQGPYPYASPSFGWVQASFAACRDILNTSRLAELKAPVRIIGGSEDAVIEPKAWPVWCMTAAKHASVPVDFIRVTDGRHELLNEIPKIRKRSISLLKTWLECYLPAPVH